MSNNAIVKENKGAFGTSVLEIRALKQLQELVPESFEYQFTHQFQFTIRKGVNYVFSTKAVENIVFTLLPYYLSSLLSCSTGGWRELASCLYSGSLSSLSGTLCRKKSIVAIIDYVDSQRRQGDRCKSLIVELWKIDAITLLI